VTNQQEMKALRDAKAAAAKVTETEQSMRDRYATLVTERTTIATASPSLDELLTNARRLVDEAAARWAERCAREVVRTIGGYTEAHGPTGTPDRVVAPSLPRNRYGSEPDSLGLEDLCGLAPALMKERLEQVIRGSSARFGLPAEARAQQLDELDRQIAELASQHSELVDAAAEVGITLPLLEAVRARREAEARRIEREQEIARQRVYVERETAARAGHGIR